MSWSGKWLLCCAWPSLASHPAQGTAQSVESGGGCVLQTFPWFCLSLDGGELFSRIQDRGDQAFTERGTKDACGTRWGRGLLLWQMGPERLVVALFLECRVHRSKVRLSLCLSCPPSTPNRSLRNHEEHRRSHPVFALNQHCPSGCQGTGSCGCCGAVGWELAA